jgi:hypothetical protein
MLLKIITAGVIGLVIGLGLMYFALTVIRPPEVPQLKVVAELAETQYQVGEEISVKPSLVNMGKRPITVFGGVPILFVKVYDTENRVVLRLPVAPSLDILVSRTLEPQTPYYTKYRKPLLEGYTFVLEQPGRYKVVAWAELSLDKNYDYPLHIYAAEPIWIEVRG